jgi:hypothetical protein
MPCIKMETTILLDSRWWKDVKVDSPLPGLPACARLLFAIYLDV